MSNVISLTHESVTYSFIEIFELKEKFDVSLQTMERYSSSGSNISLDSLEIEFEKKSAVKKKISEDNIDTILVPFYENDVLIKVQKGKKTKCKHEGNKNNNVKDKFKKEPVTSNSYLVNRDVNKQKRSSYLEMFRKQFAPTQIDSKNAESEIRSISPEFGDTERESFVEDANNPDTEFLNTESYNEIYYAQLLNQDLNSYRGLSYDEQLKLSGHIRSKSPDDIDYNNLKSISDVSQPHRRIRRATVQPIQNVQLGGLGPDMEYIKPRLDRARSLQRYSEKVRMENRVKIYKKSVQEDIEKKAHLVKLPKSAQGSDRKNKENSYLINKTMQNKESQNVRSMCNSKSKSSKGLKSIGKEEEKNESSNVKNSQDNNQYKKASNPKAENNKRVNSDDKSNINNDPGIKELAIDVPVPPVHISFLVNMAGIRPSSALRKLEAKHKMYQEKVKAFTGNKDNNSDNN